MKQKFQFSASSSPGIPQQGTKFNNLGAHRGLFIICFSVLITSYWGCSYCLITGEYVEKHIYYPEIHSTLRDPAAFRRWATMGIWGCTKGIPPWFDLTDSRFNCVDNFLIDSMHLVIFVLNIYIYI